nr:hypothetical protein [Mycobacteroides abscessus]
MPHACLVAGTSEQALIAAVQRRLADRYKHLPEERVAAMVQEVHASFVASPVRDFVPLLVERRASAMLEKVPA